MINRKNERIIQNAYLDTFIAHLFTKELFDELINNNAINNYLNQIAASMIEMGYSCDWIKETLIPEIINEYDLKEQIEYESSLIE